MRAGLFMAIGLLLSVGAAVAEAQEAREAGGTVSGQVVGGDTQRGLGSASVALGDGGRTVLADAEGRFTIADVPFGNQTLLVRRIGYATQAVPDVIVRPGRTTAVRVEMVPAAVEIGGITTGPSYFERSTEEKASSIRFTAEEVRRAPGSAGDISRIILGLPSLAKTNDQYNGLAVRGGSATENLFLVDNIPIPNINHFPSQGSSGGAVSLLNVDLLEDVRFHAGGFGAAYGGRLSSVMEMDLRDGNTEEIDGQLDLNFAGFGGVVEGPLPGSESGSWIVSARRSFLDLLVNAADVGTTLAPRYGDAQARLTLHAGPNHRFSALGIWSQDLIESDLDTAIENDMQTYGSQDLTQATMGINWRALWGTSTFSNTSISLSLAAFDEQFTETATGLPLLANGSTERALRLRNVNQSTLGRTTLGYGFEAEHLFPDYSIEYGAHDGPAGTPIDPLSGNASLAATSAAAFLSARLPIAARLDVNAGIRLDAFGLHDQVRVGPRGSASYRATDRTTLNLAAGLYHQPLPAVLLAQNAAHRDLAVPSAVHLVAGAEHLVRPDMRLTVEAYRKWYSNQPIDPDHPDFFVLDEPVFGNSFYDAHHRLDASGAAEAEGVEATLQKRFSGRMYGLASAALFRTRYRDGLGVWRDRVYDNRMLLAGEAGYQLPSGWTLSGRWIYAGGAPYTPIDEAASRAAGRTMLDPSQANSHRYPDYHSLNLRMDRRFNFRRSNLALYLSVWNAYGRQNVSSYYWNSVTQEIEPVLQWGTLPIFGLEYEF